MAVAVFPPDLYVLTLVAISTEGHWAFHNEMIEAIFRKNGEEVETLWKRQEEVSGTAL